MNTRLLITLFLTLCSFAQPSFLQLDNSIRVFKDNKWLDNPFGGGLNAPMFFQGYLDKDTFLDIIIYDLSAQNYLWFEFEENKWKQKFEWTGDFPPTHHFARWVDINKDSLLDLITTFSYYGTGAYQFTIYYNTSPGSDTLSFTNGDTIPGIMRYGYEIPGILDFDYDGDLDMIIFKLIRLEYYQNVAVESLSRDDTLIWVLADSTFGLVSEDPFSCSIFLYDTVWNFNLRHTGGYVTAYDINNDSVPEIFHGDVACHTLNVFHGHWDSTHSPPKFIITDSIIGYPIPHRCFMKLTPGAYFIDYDHSGRKQLIVAPATASPAAIDIKNVFYYVDTSSTDSAIFILVDSALFVKEMIDVGEGARPAIEDVTADGIPDILIAPYNRNSPVIQENYTSIALYRTMPTNPITLMHISDDWDSTGAKLLFQMRRIAIAFHDFDEDGDRDMLIGNASNILYYGENVALPGEPATFVINLSSPFMQVSDVNTLTPYFFDIDGDGDEDLLLGTNLGNIVVYENRSGGFFLKTGSFHNINVRLPDLFEGFSVPAAACLDSTGLPYLFVGSYHGTVYVYQSIDSFLDDDKTVVDIELVDSFNPGLGLHAFPTFGDIDTNGVPDLVIGGYGGGIRIYRNLIPPEKYKPCPIKISPDNPPTNDTDSSQTTNPSDSTSLP
ncbi:MAG: VCBS repeat-containing protein, partial [Chlorobi bacterium]|nr:VCBS repeat-containing protein [Chlorobiota bacterium]